MKSYRYVLVLVLSVGLLLAFGGAIALADRVLTLPSKLEVIDAEAFMGDQSFDQVLLPEGIRQIGARAFVDSSLSQIYLPGSLESIDISAFDGPDKVTVFAPTGSFAYNWALTNGYLHDESDYPESLHPYDDDSDISWTYIYPRSVEGLAITFSDATMLETNYDYLTITDAMGLSHEYTGDELMGKRIITLGNQFLLQLTSDSSVNEYGFKIVSIEPASAAEVQSLTALYLFTTREIDDDTLAITRYLSDETDVVIPDSIDGHKVVSIDPGAFDGHTGLTTLTLPATISDIDISIYDSSPDLVLLVHYNSPALEYAWENELAFEVLDMPESPIIIHSRNFDEINRKQYNVGENVMVKEIRTDLESAYLALFDESGNKLAEWNAEDESYDHILDRFWFIEYAYSTAGIHRMIFRTSVDGSTWYARADENESPLYVAVGNWYDKVTGKPAIYSSSISTLTPIVDIPFVFSVQTSLNTRRIYAHKDGKRIGSWDAEDCACLYGDKLLWKLEHTFTHAGEGGYVSFEALSNDNTSGIDSVNTVLVDYIAETFSYDMYFNKTLRELSEKYHTNGVGYNSDGYFIELWDYYTSATGGSVRGTITFRAAGPDEYVRSITVDRTPHARVYGIKCGMLGNEAAAILLNNGWTRNEYDEGFFRDDKQIRLSIYEDSFDYPGDAVHEIVVETFDPEEW